MRPGADQIELSGYVPGAIAGVTGLHARYYHDNWGFGLYFESKVATELSEFLNRFREGRDGFWVATSGGQIVGSIAIDGMEAGNRGARLRWFIVAPELQGRGIGRRLMREALDFCRRAGIKRVYLWTFAGLDAARHLYEEFGFVLREEHRDTQWGKMVLEQLFDLYL
jgi:GNAT superfamily N-acetyltransferase